MALERIHKIIAREGIASRRNSEKLVEQGLVTINGRVAKIGDQAEAGKDAIKVNGKLLLYKQEPVYVAFNKPKGVITTMTPDPQGRQNLAPYLKKVRGRIYPIGRMDFNSEGLLLLTNDGDFAEKVQKNGEIPRIYSVKIKGHPEASDVEKLGRTARVNGKIISPYSARLEDRLLQKSFIEMIFIGQGAIDVKAYFEFKGYLVERIIRKAIGQISTHGLKPGEYKLLKKSQVEALLREPDLALRAQPKEEPPEPVRREPRIKPAAPLAARSSGVRVRPLVEPLSGKRNSRTPRGPLTSRSHIRMPQNKPKSKSF